MSNFSYANSFSVSSVSDSTSGTEMLFGSSSSSSGSGSGSGTPASCSSYAITLAFSGGQQINLPNVNPVTPLHNMLEKDEEVSTLDLILHNSTCWGPESEITLNFPSNKLEIYLPPPPGSTQRFQCVSGVPFLKNMIGWTGNVSNGYATKAVLKATHISTNINDFVITASGMPKAPCSSGSGSVAPWFHPVCSFPPANDTPEEKEKKKIKITAYSSKIEVMQKPLDGSAGWTASINKPKIINGKSRPCYYLNVNNEHAIRSEILPQILGNEVGDTTFSGILVTNFISGTSPSNAAKPAWKKITSGVGSYVPVLATVHFGTTSSASTLPGGVAGIMILSLNLSIDSDNDDGFALPKNDSLEEFLEDHPYALGKLVRVNAQTVPDPSDDLTPIRIHIPPGLDPNDPHLKISLIYGSDIAIWKNRIKMSQTTGSEVGSVLKLLIDRQGCPFLWGKTDHFNKFRTRPRS